MSLDVTFPPAVLDTSAEAWEQDRALTGQSAYAMKLSFGVAPQLASAWGVDANTARAIYEEGVAKHAGSPLFAGATDRNNANLAPAWGALELARRTGNDTPELLAFLQRYTDEGDRAKELRNAEQKKSFTGNLLKFGGLLAAVTLPGVLGLYPGQGVAAAATQGGNVAQGLQLSRPTEWGLRAAVASDAPVSAGLGATGTGGVTGLVAPQGFAFAPNVGTTLTQAAQGLKSGLQLASSAGSSASSTSGVLSQLQTGAGAVRAITGAAAAGAGALGALRGQEEARKPETVASAQPATSPFLGPAGMASGGLLLLAAAGVAVYYFMKR